MYHINSCRCLFYLISGCSIELSESLRYGEIANERFSVDINIEVEKGLIFLPVSINGKEYRFLFDTGAPLSISEEMQNEYAYKSISKGNIVDSDRNKKKVDWVQVDTLNIGEAFKLSSIVNIIF